MARKPPQQRSNYEKRLKSSAAKVPAAPAPAVVHKRQGNRDSGDDDPAADVLLRAAAVRRRYGGASDMWIHRRLNDNTGFPRPIYLGTIRHWRLSWSFASSRKAITCSRLTEGNPARKSSIDSPASR